MCLFFFYVIFFSLFIYLIKHSRMLILQTQNNFLLLFYIVARLLANFSSEGGEVRLYFFKGKKKNWFRENAKFF